MRIESLVYLIEAQHFALDSLTALVRIEQIDLIVAQDPRMLCARLEAFVRYEPTLLGQVHDCVVRCRYDIHIILL